MGAPNVVQEQPGCHRPENFKKVWVLPTCVDDYNSDSMDQRSDDQTETGNTENKQIIR